MRSLALVSASLWLSSIASVTSAQSASLAGGLQMPPDAVKEWKVPWEKSVPRDPYVDQQGRVWFVGQMGNYIASLDPARGDFKRYEIDPGTYPHNRLSTGTTASGSQGIETGASCTSILRPES